MPDDTFAARLFILRQKVCRSRKSDLRNILFDLLFGHADPVILNGERFRILVDPHVDAVAALIRSAFAHIGKFFELCDRVRRVGDDLTDKNIFIRIQPLFDDGHHVFAGDLNISLFSHINTSV